MESDELFEVSKARQAVSILYKLIKLKKKDQTVDLLSNDESQRILLELTLKKPIGLVKSRKIIKVTLPHPFIHGNFDVGLIVKNLVTKDNKPDDDETIHHYEDLLQSKKITGITKVIPYHQLKVEHLTKEAKSQFLDLYDTLFVDSRIKGMLPSTLGNSMFRKNKLGKNVNMEPEKMISSIQKAFKTTELNIPGYGSSCIVQIGLSDQSEKEILKNIQAFVDKLKLDLPGGFANVRELDLTSDSVMKIPVFISLGSRNDVKIPSRKKHANNVDAEEVDTVVGAKVKVTDNFNIKIINDVDMDSDIDEDVMQRFRKKRISKPRNKKQFKAKTKKGEAGKASSGLTKNHHKKAGDGKKRKLRSDSKELPNAKAKKRQGESVKSKKKT